MSDLACECLDHVLPTCPYHADLKMRAVAGADRGDHREGTMPLDWLRKPEGTRVDEKTPTGPDRTTTNFATGMQRSGALNHLDYTSIHPIALIALARTLGGEGSVKYGRCNYELGSPVHDSLNHVFGHLNMYLAGDRSEPHLEHAFCGMMFAVVNDTLYPELNEPHLRGPGCRVTPAMIEHLEAGRPERQRRREAGEFDHLGDWKLSEVPEVARILAQRAEAESGETSAPHPG